MEKLKMQTPDITDENINSIAALFPNVITETRDASGNIQKAVDFDLLRQMLSASLVEDGSERYRLDWPGKKASLLKANTPVSKTLRPCREESVNFDSTENLYIEGDNFDVLKILQESYLGKIKMIYIDPPYNTGNDFIYKDNFFKSKDEYEEELGIFDEQGGKLVKNTDTNGRFHSDWLSMMYERLLVARDLLTDDGVIFISIDDNEVHNLRKICDEIFGEENFRGLIIRATGTTTGQDSMKIGSSYDSCLCFSKSSLNKLKGIPLKGKDLNRFNNDDNDGKGKYALLQLRKTGNADRKEDRESMFFPVSAPDGTPVYPIGPSDYLSRWRVGKETFNRFIKDNLIVWKENDASDEFEDDNDELENDDFDNNNIEENQSNTITDLNTINNYKSKWKPYVKYYLSDRTKQVSNLWMDVDGNKKGSIELKTIFEKKKIFNNPKPLDFVKRIMIISISDNDIILDFFSGSATTAHAVMQLNAEDGGNRKFIMVQLPEACDESSEAYKAGYKTIAEIGKERIRRAGKKIVESYELQDKSLELQDKSYEFRVTREELEELEDKSLELQDKSLELIVKSLEKEEDSYKFQVTREEMEKYGCVKLPESDRLAKGDGAGQGNLFACQETAQGGTVQPFESDAPGSSLDSVEHSGRQREADGGGIQAVSSDSQGLGSRVGNTTADMHKSGLPCPYGYKASTFSVDGNQQDADCPHENTKNCPLLTTHLKLVTTNSQLVTSNSKLLTLDTGFRVYKVDTSNMKDVFYHPEKIDQITLDSLYDNFKDDRTPEDILTQILLDLGLTLDLPIEERKISGNTVYFVQTNALAACFDKDIDFAIIDKIAAVKPFKAVFKDSCFKSDDERINLEERFKMLSPETKVWVV